MCACVCVLVPMCQLQWPLASRLGQWVMCVFVPMCQTRLEQWGVFVCMRAYVCPHVSVTLAFGQSTWAVGVCVLFLNQCVSYTGLWPVDLGSGGMCAYVCVLVPMCQLHWPLASRLGQWGYVCVCVCSCPHVSVTLAFGQSIWAVGYMCLCVCVCVFLSLMYQLYKPLASGLERWGLCVCVCVCA